MTVGPDFKLGLVALHRFGLGARGGSAGDLASAASDPRGFLKAELARPQPALLEGPGLHGAIDNLQGLYRYQEEVRLARQAIAAAPQQPAADNTTPAVAAAPVPQPPDAKFIQQTFRAETLARHQRQFAVDAGFVERLASFWSNHFCVSASKDGFVRVTAGSFEREAIRPHVFGRFADMLLAVAKHQAMQRFLDNMQSIGPGSRAGRNSKRGLNENLAREIMELHTLGVGGGYTQADVTSLARVLTGWTVVGPPGALGQPGSFAFNPNAHEPGPQVILGKTYPEGGLGQGEAVLHDIARHPSTAKFIAAKFARHFVADDPPAALVERLTGVFRDSDGDLKALTLALIDSDEAWSPELTKMRSPQEFLIALNRLTGRMPEDPGRINGGFALLGQPIWQPPGPNGYPDRVAAWASPEGMKLRLDIANDVARRLGDALNPDDLVEIAFGEAASSATRQAIKRAESKQQAMALLLMSPEFQRR